MGKRIRAQRRGRGSVFKTPSHRFKGEIRYPAMDSGTAVIEEIEHDPGRTAPIAKVRLEDGRKHFIIAPEGISIDQKLHFGKEAPVVVGNVLPLSMIPDGLPVFNIEKNPGDGGKFVRSAGTAAVVISHGKKVMLQLPSGNFKPFEPECRATLGIPGGGGRREKPVVKAGRKSHYLRSRAKCWPRVSGVAMNSVDHPHGGGGHQHVGKPSTVSRNAPPGRKVGILAPKKRRKKKKKKQR